MTKGGTNQVKNYPREEKIVMKSPGRNLSEINRPALGRSPSRSLEPLFSVLQKKKKLVLAGDFLLLLVRNLDAKLGAESNS